jgi:O-antigen ligase
MNAVATSLHPWIIRLLCTYAFLLPFSSWLASLSLALLFILCIVYKIAARKLFRFSSFIMFWLMLFYLLHVTGLLYTTNFSYAGLDLQIKLSFFLMPLLIDMIPVPDNDFRRITRAFIAGCTLFSFVLLLNACIEYFFWRDLSSFFYIDFCSLQHVAYLTLYINCALFFLADEFFRVPGYKLRNRYFLVIWVIFLFIIVTLLSSRTAQLATFISFPLYCYWLSTLSKNKTTSVIFAGSTAITMLVVFFIVSGNKNRFETATPTPVPNTVLSTVDVSASSGVKHNVRFEVWKNTFALYKQHPLIGVGTGDIKEELNDQYLRTGFTEGIEFNLSPHNQFFHTLLLLGIPGIISLLMILILATLKAWTRKNYLLISLLIATIINCVTEGILEKQAGVLFFVFFLILLAERNITAQQKAAA